jgi:magnesium transporter
LIGETVAPYLRDVYDHTIQVIETIETLRDAISSTLDIYLSSLSNKMNEVMKVLTIIATIFIPLTFIAGIYGMNFKVHARTGMALGISGCFADHADFGRFDVAWFQKEKLVMTF